MITSNARSQKERNDHAQNKRSDRGEEREPAAAQLAFARSSGRMSGCRQWRHLMRSHSVMSMGGSWGKF